MIELLFTTCLSAAPDVCQERQMLFQDVTPTQCMVGAQAELAKWTETHPKEHIAPWKCKTFNPNEKTL